VYHAPIVQTVKQSAQLFREMYTEDMTTMQHTTRIADSSMRIEHIINPM
jgi:hypothetical protein